MSTSVDAATDEVVAELQRRGIATTRLNTEDLPFRRELKWSLDHVGGTPMWSLDVAGQRSELAVVRPTRVWYRRVRSAPRPEGMDAGVHEFCLRESRAAVLGSVLGLAVPMMSRPDRVWAAEQKVFQLAQAKQVGLPVPRTVITNSPPAVLAAYRRWDRKMIVKPVRTGYVETANETLAIYTTRLLDEHLDHVDEARAAPSIYQEWLPKESDVRVTWVGGRFFCAEILSQTDPAAETDWRRTERPDLPHRKLELPEEVLARLAALMGRLDLEFGAIDMARVGREEYVFLEVNPNGQWLWIDDALGLGITDAVASWLAGCT